ncbi:hypothetical protein NL676_017881 [Syzygium grande]|nr:hypothetical protein NL676_017881 [Syzygium grande]
MDASSPGGRNTASMGGEEDGSGWKRRRGAKTYARRGARKLLAGNGVAIRATRGAFFLVGDGGGIVSEAAHCAGVGRL